MLVTHGAIIVYRFGPFEVTTGSNELLRQGVRVRLQDQPFRLLIVLLENAGEVVSHEDIQRRIWENNTFVEFDSSLRVAVRKLRDALGDDADNPHYIETIPRRGYRFLGPVVSVKGSDSEKMLIGQVISHYRLIGKVGSGGMGVVYEAEDIRLGRRVALKFLPENLARDPRALRRFQREARAASSLNHPNICTLHEVEEHGSQPVIVMELLLGESLKDRIRKGAISADQLLDIGIQTAVGLEAAHAKGIVHRDIKPGNIFIVGGGRVKILDFGLAKVVPGDVPENESEEESLTVEGVIPGTTSYLSPEQVRGEEADARSDLFALGVVLYEMATSQRPFAGKNRVVLMDAILNANPVAPSRLNLALPPALDSVIARSLEKDRERRYQNTTDLCSDLRRVKGASAQAAIASATPSVRGKARHATRWRIAMAAGVAAAVIAGVAFFYSCRTPALTEKDTIVLADFDNKTGDPVFDGALRQGMAVQLGQSPFLSLISGERTEQMLRMMGQPADARLTPGIAREICERTASAAVLDGSIASLGSQYVLGISARNCRNGGLIDEEQIQVRSKEEVLKALSQIATKFRAQVGESLTTVEKHNTPLAEATTPSLEALKAYSAGWKVLSSTGSATAVPFFKHAIEIDPRFAMAYASLGRMYGDMGEYATSAESTTKAFQLRDRATDRERFFISASYDMTVTGDLEEAQQTCQLWAHTYPRDAGPHSFLSGIIYPPVAKYEGVVEEGRKSVELDPDSAIAYDILAIGYAYLNRPGEAKSTLQRAYERKLEIPDYLVERYDLAFLTNDQLEMDREAALGQRTPAAEDWISGHEAFVLAYSGRLQQAREMSRHAQDLAQQSARRETAALYETGAALREGLFGNTPTARRSALAALDLSTGREVEYGAAFALALSGDYARSQTLESDLERRFHEDTSVKFNYAPTLRALLALNQREPAKALKLLEMATPYELSAPRCSFFGFFGALYPVYVRGEAYLALHQGGEAAAEFQKIIDHQGIVVSDPIGALARLQLGRAFALSGDKTKAKAAYQNFLTLWKEADPDIPILKAAKAEYSKLQHGPTVKP